MKRMLLTTVFLMAVPLMAAATDEHPHEAAKKILAAYIEQQGHMFDALKGTKTEADLQRLDQVILQASTKMAECAKNLASLGPFDNQTAHTLWSVMATFEYERLGDMTMGDALQATPEALQRECKDSSVKARTRHWSAALAADGA